MYSEVHGSGYPLLCLHGLPLDHRSLLPLDRAFADSGKWKRIYVDLPGMGESSSSPDIKGYNGVFEALRKLIVKEIGEEKYAIFGYSFGAFLGRALIRDDPNKVLGFGMLCPEVIANQKLRRLPQKKTVEHDTNLLSSLNSKEREIYTATSVIETRDNWERFAEFILPAFSEFDKKAITSIVTNTSLPGLPEPSEFRYEGPTLVITGRQDNMVGYHDAFDILRNYSKASYTMLDRAGHTAHLDQPKLVSILIKDWLERIVANINNSLDA